MEYAMSTLMLGNGTLEGIYGTATHELGHSWFQHVLASNESKHPWMDEGFTTYVSDLAENELQLKKVANPFEGNYRAYYSLVNSERATTNYPWRPL
jgi:aminopeptidase N